MERVFKTSTGFKVGCWVIAVLCGVFVVMLPFSLAVLWLAYRAQVRVTDDKIVVRWFGTREHAWSDIAKLAWVRGGGAVGGAMRPMSYELRSKPNANPRIAIGALQGSEELLAIITAKTGMEPK
jgi:hypothetical protein